MRFSNSWLGVIGLVALSALATTGCATKKYVRQQVDPVNQHVSDVDKKQTDNLAKLEDKTNKDVSRVEERAMTAENKANDAARAAQQADSKADQAGQAAQNARQLAEQAQNKLNDVEKVVNSIDSYKLVSTEKVLFGFNKAQLNKDAQGKLDSLVQNAASNNRYVFEVEGFTDHTGPKDYNMTLSQRRADAVMVYLVNHNVPLRRIHMVGLGEQTPEMAKQISTDNQGQATNENMTKREMRKEMRSVVVRVYAPESTLSASAQGAQGQNPR